MTCLPGHPHPHECWNRRSDPGEVATPALNFDTFSPALPVQLIFTLGVQINLGGGYHPRTTSAHFSGPIPISEIERGMGEYFAD